MKKLCLNFLASIVIISMNAQDIQLLPPDKTGGKPFMETLWARKSYRDFSSEKLPLQQLSNLLWAANGVNRQDGRRTAPSARNMQEIDIYVFTSDAIYLYEAPSHVLKLVKAGDARKMSARNDFAHTAPLVLVYVANRDKMPGMDETAATLYGATDCGNVTQNVHLFCASEGLHTVSLGNIDREQIKKLLGFHGEALLAQPVGKGKQQNENPLLGHRWKLIELNGKAFPEQENKKEIFIFLNEDGTMNGNLGCNNVSGTYVLKEGNRIAFPGLVQTKMACLNKDVMNTETELSKVLNLTDSYLIENNVLVLHRARMSPLAKFVKVE
ncbi:MAG: nitroreductase family protein [Bacteroidales bacterium]|nr:nitroreductase family protein [Bacteroidales bacterium]